MKKEERITITYPAVRQFTADTGKINRDKHYIRALLEVDVSEALHKLKMLRTPERKISFLAWFIKVLGDSVAEHPPIDGVRSGRFSVDSFKEIDVSTIVEKQVDGTGVPLPLILRSVNQRAALEIEQEIASAKKQEVDDAGDYVLGKGGDQLLIGLAARLPQWARLFFMRQFVLRNPARLKQMMGTVMVTSLGMTGRIAGWIIPTSMHPLSIGIGTLKKKPVVHRGEIVRREILHLTIAIDHDVIDGMPAMRFVDMFVSRLEDGVGLDAF